MTAKELCDDPNPWREVRRDNATIKVHVMARYPNDGEEALGDQLADQLGDLNDMVCQDYFGNLGIDLTKSRCIHWLGFLNLLQWACGQVYLIQEHTELDEITSDMVAEIDTIANYYAPDGYRFEEGVDGVGYYEQ